MQVSKVSPHWHSILQSICAPLKLAIHVLKNLAGSGRTCRLAQSVAAVVAQKWIYPSTSVPLPCWYILARSAPQAIDSSANLCILMAGKFPHGQNTMRQWGRVPNSPQICWWGESGQFCMACLWPTLVCSPTADNELSLKMNRDPHMLGTGLTDERI